MIDVKDIKRFSLIARSCLFDFYRQSVLIQRAFEQFRDRGTDEPESESYGERDPSVSAADPRHNHQHCGTESLSKAVDEVEHGKHSSAVGAGVGIHEHAFEVRAGCSGASSQHRENECEGVRAADQDEHYHRQSAACYAGSDKGGQVFPVLIVDGLAHGAAHEGKYETT